MKYLIVVTVFIILANDTFAQGIEYRGRASPACWSSGITEDDVYRACVNPAGMCEGFSSASICAQATNQCSSTGVNTISTPEVGTGVPGTGQAEQYMCLWSTGAGVTATGGVCTVAGGSREGIVVRDGDGFGCQTTTPCDAYDPDWVDTDLFGNDEFCTPLYDQDENECQNVEGYVNDTQICADDRLDCESRGGTYGQWTPSAGSEVETVCIPNELIDETVDTCDISSVQVVTGDANSYGFVCSAGATPPLEGDPTDSGFTERDTDGDGIPDSDDPDIDGDGINNGLDDDIDGDGVPNADDQDSNRDRGSLSGGGSCGSPPRCQGDPVACGVVLQTWSTRCEVKNQSGVLADIRSNTDGIEQGVDDLVDAFTGNHSDTLAPIPEQTAPGFDLEEDFDLGGIADDIFGGTGAAGSCPAPVTISTSIVGSFQLPYDNLCTFAGYAKYLLLMSAALASMRIIWRGLG